MCQNWKASTCYWCWTRRNYITLLYCSFGEGWDKGGVPQVMAISGRSLLVRSFQTLGSDFGFSDTKWIFSICPSSSNSDTIDLTRPRFSVCKNCFQKWNDISAHDFVGAEVCLREHDVLRRHALQANLAYITCCYSLLKKYSCLENLNLFLESEHWFTWHIVTYEFFSRIPKILFHPSLLWYYLS